MASTSFAYTGADQLWTVPAGVTFVDVDTYGAAGAGFMLSGSFTGGLGGRTRCRVPTTPGEQLIIRVGGEGVLVPTQTPAPAYPGGGSTDGQMSNVYGGGGYSGLFRGSTPLAIAGAGGGTGQQAGGNRTGGHGGGLSGTNPGFMSDPANGMAGKQELTAHTGSYYEAEHGSYLLGGDGDSGGGGGYYGGGGGRSYCGGAGGSGFAAANATSVVMDTGVRSGNGALTLTYNDPPGQPGAFTSPAAGAVFDATGNVAWGAASDPQGDGLTYDAELSTNGGSSWSTVRTKAAGTSFTFDYSSTTATTAARWRVRAWDGFAYGPWRESSNFTVQHNLAPNAPTLQEPPNGSAVNLATGYTFRLTPNDPDSGDSTLAYVFRRKVSGAGAYEYWNAGLAAWQSTEVWNTVTAVPKGQQLAVTFGSGKWTTGTVYNWSAKTRDAQGVGGVFAGDFTVTANVPPTVDVLTPSGTVTTTSRPIISWSYTDPENEPQTAYEAKVFTAAQYGAGGFSADTSASVWSSGVQLSETARDVQVGTDLANGTQYRAYVRTRQTIGGAWSAWAWELFTLQLERPLAPLVVVTPEPQLGQVRLDIAGTDDGVPFSAANSYFSAEWSDDNGATWWPVRGGTMVKAGQTFTATIYDREAPPGSERWYRVATVGDV